MSAPWTCGVCGVNNGPETVACGTCRALAPGQSTRAAGEEVGGPALRRRRVLPVVALILLGGAWLTVELPTLDEKVGGAAIDPLGSAWVRREASLRTSAEALRAYASGLAQGAEWDPDGARLRAILDGAGLAEGRSGPLPLREAEAELLRGAQELASLRVSLVRGTDTGGAEQELRQIEARIARAEEMLGANG